MSPLCEARAGCGTPVSTYEPRIPMSYPHTSMSRAPRERRRGAGQENIWYTCSREKPSPLLARVASGVHLPTPGPTCVGSWLILGPPLSVVAFQGRPFAPSLDSGNRSVTSLFYSASATRTQRGLRSCFWVVQNGGLRTTRSDSTGSGRASVCLSAWTLSGRGLRPVAALPSPAASNIQILPRRAGGPPPTPTPARRGGPTAARRSDVHERRHGV